MQKPWQVVLDYNEAIGNMLFILMLNEHPHGSISFTEAAAEFCGGAIEQDDDRYVVRCRDEHFSVIEQAREIARMSETDVT